MKTRLAQMIRCAIYVLILLMLPSVANACPTCKDTLHDNGAATGYAISILFMMMMPALITAFWGIMIWRLRRAGNHAPSVDPFPNLCEAQPSEVVSS